MENLNGEETLWVTLPILLVVGILVASIIILPRTQTETSSKASEPKPTITATPLPARSANPEIVCSSLYSPVCSQNGVTYASECEAAQAGVTAFTQGACPKAKATPRPLPASN